jgi:hypothetical protein
VQVLGEPDREIVDAVTANPLSTDGTDAVAMVIDGWNAGFQKIKFTKLLQQEAGCTLAEAKHATDDILAGRPVRVSVPATRARDFAAEAVRLGIRDIKAQ